MPRALLAGLVCAALAVTSGEGAQPAATPAELDTRLAPIALYPDQLLAPMLLSAANPGAVSALGEWLRSHDTPRGSELPASYDSTGIVTFIVSHDVMREKDLGPETDATGRTMRVFDPDASWTAVHEEDRP
jgi:hypothetical protein